LDYGLRTNTRKFTAYFFKRWFTAINKFPKYTEYHAETLLTKPDEKVSRRLTAIMFEDGRLNYPKNNKIKTAQLSFFRSWLKEPSNKTILNDKLNMCSSLMKDFGRTSELKSGKIKLLREVFSLEMASGNMEPVWQTYRELQIETGTVLKEMRAEIAKRDFEVRFVGSAIPYDKVGKSELARTGWTGSSKYCDPGRVPDSTLKRL